MIGLLSDEEIDAMLWRNRVGRLACASNDRPYIVPINYAYDGCAVYAYSSVGRKIGVMREQPLVSFEIDEVESGSAWRSVIVEGRYEELTGDDRMRALALLARNGDAPVARTLGDGQGAQIVLFRILVDERSGRFERRDA
jgi:nitroimidazol reductase NimA-like FMN-containing flavoprotein (pyridoxamine 5'-phosphate oxidase superfamily)